MQMASRAPRLKHSKLSAPVPPKSSSTRESGTRAARLLNTACLTRSGVGRTARPFGTFNKRRACFPPVTHALLYRRGARNVSIDLLGLIRPPKTGRFTVPN